MAHLDGTRDMIEIDARLRVLVLALLILGGLAGLGLIIYLIAAFVL